MKHTRLLLQAFMSYFLLMILSTASASIENGWPVTINIDHSHINYGRPEKSSK